MIFEGSKFSLEELLFCFVFFLLTTLSIKIPFKSVLRGNKAPLFHRVNILKIHIGMVQWCIFCLKVMGFIDSPGLRCIAQRYSTSESKLLRISSIENL